MAELISRKKALGIIDSIFSAFHAVILSVPDYELENTPGIDNFIAAAREVDEKRFNPTYEQTLNALDSEGFRQYYLLVVEFARQYRITHWEEYVKCEPLVLEDLNDELLRHEDTGEKLEIIKYKPLVKCL